MVTRWNPTMVIKKISVHQFLPVVNAGLATTTRNFGNHIISSEFQCARANSAKLFDFYLGIINDAPR